MSDVLQHIFLNLNTLDKTLWCADENISPESTKGFTGVIVTNRFDLYTALTDKPVRCTFSDFDIEKAMKSYQPNRMIFQIAKEKAINHHLIIRFFQHFTSGDELIMLGHKQQGMMSLIRFITALGAQIVIKKHKNKCIEACITHGAYKTIDTDYNRLLPLPNTELVTKMGAYGYNKVDKGSIILIEALQQLLTEKTLPEPSSSLLDLGCGYGYLSVKAHELGFNNIVATDNCAGAIIACQHNFKHFGIDGDVIAADCAKSIQQTFDVVLCNPPFHQGFDHKKSLTESFVKSAHQHLKKQGFALFVVNQFIGIEKQAETYFTNCTLLVKKAGYKVLLLDDKRT